MAELNAYVDRREPGLETAGFHTYTLHVLKLQDPHSQSLKWRKAFIQVGLLLFLSMNIGRI